MQHASFIYKIFNYCKVNLKYRRFLYCSCSYLLGQDEKNKVLVSSPAPVYIFLDSFVYHVDTLTDSIKLKYFWSQRETAATACSARDSGYSFTDFMMLTASTNLFCYL